MKAEYKQIETFFGGGGAIDMHKVGKVFIFVILIGVAFFVITAILTFYNN